MPALYAAAESTGSRRKIASNTPLKSGTYITFEELGAKLSDLEEIRTTAVEKLEAIRNYQERIEEMEKDRDALLESYALRAPEALNELTPEERHHVYRMLRLRAAITIGGTIERSGMFGEGSEFCHSETRSWTRFESTKHSELRFRALLTNGAREVRFESAVRG